MGNSFQDQFLKAGVINKQQAQKASGAKRKKQKMKDHGAAAKVDADKVAAKQMQAEKVLHDRELNQKRQQEAERKAIAAQIQQLISLNRLSFEEDDETIDYNFVDGKLVCKIRVPENIHAQLGNGVLSIVKFKQGYSVIPAVVAQKISDRDPSLIIAIKQSEKIAVADDPYADYQVPDDLMW